MSGASRSACSAGGIYFGHHQLRARKCPPHLVRADRGLGLAGSGSGRDRRGRRGRHLAGPPGRRLRSDFMDGTPPPSSSPSRSAESATTSTRSSWWPDRIPGVSDLPRPPPRGLPRYATFQPTFLYEIIWNLPGRLPRLARPPPQIQAARPLRPLRRRLLGLPHLRGEPPRRPRPPLPRRAPQLLGRDRPRPRRRRLVPLDPATLSPRTHPTGRQNTPESCRFCANLVETL